MPLDQVNELGGKLGKVGQRFMDHDQFRGGGASGGPPRWTLGRNTFAPHQKDRLVGLAAQDRMVAFDEHDEQSISAEPGACKIYIALLETTY